MTESKDNTPFLYYIKISVDLEVIRKAYKYHADIRTEWMNGIAY